jgi:hypothetical protein
MRTMRSARLDAAERRALGRAAELLEQELGDQLLAVLLMAHGRGTSGRARTPTSTCS